MSPDESTKPVITVNLFVPQGSYDLIAESSPKKEQIWEKQNSMDFSPDNYKQVTIEFHDVKWEDIIKFQIDIKSRH